jgi:hypothetical protein
LLLRWVARDDWERKLRALGADPLAGKAALNTAEWWICPGKITVTVDPDGRCDFWALHRIIQQQGGDSPFAPGSLEE